MSGLPIGFMLGNVGHDDKDIEADYLDEETRSALVKTQSDFLFSLPKDLQEEAAGGVDDGEPSGPVQSVDDDLMVSEGDISEGSLPEEISQPTQVHEGTSHMDPRRDSLSSDSEDESIEEVPQQRQEKLTEADLPILGYGENNERIFFFSKIFTNGGLKYFFEEQKREAEQNERRTAQMAERIRRNRERQPPPLPPPNPVEAWLTDIDQGQDSDSSSRMSDGKIDDSMEDTASPSSAQSTKPHLIDRKHFLKCNLIRWEDRVATNPQEGKRCWAEFQDEWKSIKGQDGHVVNPDLLKDDWLDNVFIFRDQKPPSPKLTWDLNDPHMRFRLQDSSVDIDFSKAAAIILPPSEKGSVFEDLAFYNISKDDQYAKDTRSVVTSKNRVFDDAVSLNAVSALSLSTVPIHLSDEAAMDYHLGLSDFYPPEKTSQLFLNKNLPDSKVEIIFRSVTGRIATVVKPVSEAAHLTVGDIYTQVQSKAFPEAKDEQPRFLVETPNIRLVDKDLTLQSLSEHFDLERNLVIWVQFERVGLIVDSMTELPSANSKLPVRPPGAFGKKKELTATEGHVLLLEYLEEYPLLHFYPGMGLVLQTWCHPREGKTAASYQEELEEKFESVRWKYGKVKMVQPDKPSPFIAAFPNDNPVFSVESHLIRAPACGYGIKATDLLLVQSPSGNWSIRKITGALAVGQQQPLVKINPPLASNIKDIEERRLVSYACRKLSQQVRKTGKKPKKNDTVIYVEELTNMFPVLSDAVIKARLKDRCQCLPLRGEEGSFTLRANATHHSETELRQILSPEEACAYDSCRTFKARMATLGLNHVDRLTQIPNDKWKLAIMMLPERMKEVARFIQRSVQGAPWNQSEGYHSWKGGKGQVSVLGPGEPSGRGICASFTKEHTRKSDESVVPVKPQPVITGTKADLRRLGAEEAISALQGLPQEMQSMLEFDNLRKMDRWEIIRHVRAIATAAVQDGVELSEDLSKFARNPRSTVQIARGLKRKIEQVFVKQLQLLRNEEVDTTPIPVKDKGLLKKDEVENKPGKRRVRRVIVASDGSQKEVVMKMDVYDNISWGGPEGVPQFTGGVRVIEGRLPATAVTEEQIVERPLMLKKPVIDRRTRTIAQFGNSRIVFGKMPQKKKKIKRQRVKLTKEDIWGNRYKYFERRRRLNNRRPRREINFIHNFESVEQEDLLKALSKPKQKRALQQALSRQQQLLKSGESLDGEEDPYLMRQASLLSELGLAGSLELTQDGKPKIPYKTKDGRRMTGRKVLNTKILNKVHQAIVKHQHAKFFKMQVNKQCAQDYNEFVPPENEIWLEKIGCKIRGLKYSTGQMFMDDMRRLRDNAVAYNTPGNGQYGASILIDYADDLVKSAAEEMDKFKESITEEEERIRVEDSEKEFKRSGSMHSSCQDLSQYL